MTHLSVFLAAFLLEAGYVLWVRSRNPGEMALLSAGIAACQVIGIDGAIHGAPVAYVLGFAAGSYAVGWWTKRLQS